MKKPSKTLLFGPLTPPYNGQAVAFTTIAESIVPEERIIINTAKFSNKILNTLYSVFKTVFIFSFYRFSTAYFVSSRSSVGFWKDFILLTLSRWKNVRIVNHLHGADFKRFYDGNSVMQPLISYSYKAVGQSIVLIDEMKGEYVDFPKMKVDTIYNCYSEDLDSFDYFVGKKKNQLLYLSNLMRSKGILEFLQACEILLDKFPELSVKIAGNALSDNFMTKEAIQKRFEQQYSILRKKYGDRIFYMGSVKGEDKKRLLFESSIFVLPSYYPTEAYPLSIIEAMRTGNAIVTTNHNYLPSIVKPSNGIIVEPYSYEAIIDGVISLLKDKIKLKKIQDLNIIEAREKYTQERYVREVKAIIEVK